ncbi:hypothetical protein FO519_003448 [Halicephalobus sp. NKZ332]|nr:hypothetical protein FO519_003448 [Halicephalobus sp. NKZ332]
MIRAKLTPKSFFALSVIVFVIYFFHHNLYQPVYEYESPEVTSFHDIKNPSAVKPLVPKIVVLNSDPRNMSQTKKKENPNASCKIPKLEKDNPKILASYTKPKPLPCKNFGKNWLFIDSTGRLQATDYGKSVIGEDNISCDASYFFRATDNAIITKKIPETVKVGFAVTGGDFLTIKCNGKGKIWKHLFMTISPKQEIIQRSATSKRPKNWSGLSVYWFSLDSMSQMAYRRSLPKTVEFLEKKMGAVVLNGYNIVGDGTPQAFIPILTGKTELELPLTRKRYPDAKFVDVYPFIWKNFSEAGYATLYGEDAAAIGTFTYRLKGFKKQPTDHYTRTFFQISEKTFPSYKCFGNEPQYKAWLRYTTEFLEKYPSEVPKFAVMHHSDLSHDDISQVQVADEDIRNHFEDLLDIGALENTVVFVGADHGHRFAALRETQQGQQEERLPFLAVHLPEKFRESNAGMKMYGNLVANADRLTSPFDIHASLMDLLDLPDDLESMQNSSERSLSIFRPIPEDRTCAQAGIEPHWCTCLSWQEGKEEVSKMLAEAVVQTINGYTAEERKLCANLKLHKLVNSKMLAPEEKMLKYSGVADKDGFVPKFGGNATASKTIYMLTFTTIPGNARYEATIEYDVVQNEVTIDMLSISHVNKYGDAPHCIIDKNYFLATYCMGENSGGSVLKLTKEDLAEACRKPTEEELTCDSCGRIFSNLGAKNMHQTKKHGIVKTEADVRLQKKISSKNKEKKMLECSDCPKLFPSMKLAIQHFQKSHMERTISCNLCLKKFAYDRDLKYHLSAKKCPGIPKEENSGIRKTRKRKKVVSRKSEFKENETFNPRLRSIETQTEPLAGMTDAWSQVYVEPYFQEPELQGSNLQAVVVDQQQQTQFEDFQQVQLQASYGYSVHRDTQTYNATNTIGTATPIWSQGYSVGEIVENGTQTWFESDQAFFQQRQMIDSFSMTDDNGFQMQ